MYRQGDVLLKPVENIPTNTTQKSLVLVEGEITGHYHQFLDPSIVSVSILNETQYVNVQQQAELVHDEHDTLFIPAGLYEVVQQREVNLLKEIQKVMD